jgi:CheY-like chemotaxis protein
LTYVNRQVTFAISPRIRGISLARKILLADDSVTAQNMGRKILADAGYEVIAVNNGSAALKKIGELKPDLVILDVYMPGYSGLEVCQRLKESPETARIPVLLTVGKLEPFKPEEAQRVRAEGFIVKPFEASELLATLSKMEDKVVPRAEPSKPGRFARAIAAAEESGRGGANADNGWKSRIGFPKDKTEEEKVADETTASGEKTWEKKQKAGQPAVAAAETNVDLAALAPAGLPKDVTPEEVAAIAAAAAQMQMVVSAIKGESQASAPKITEALAETASPSSSEPASHPGEVNLPSSPEVPSAGASEVGVEAKTEASPESKIAESKNQESKGEGSKSEEVKRDSVSEVAPAETYRRRKGDARAEETQDVPVTMAATAESVAATSPGGSRWTAVSVALEGSEAAISLDHEMQKAHAASAAADSASVARVQEAEPVSLANSFTPAPAAVEVSAPISNTEPAKAPELAASSPITAEITPVQAPADPSPTVAFAESTLQPGPVAEPAAFAAQESQPRPASEVVAAASSSTVPPSAPREEAAAEKPTAEPAPEPKFDSETVKNTAAAWASWRQVHDTNQGNEVAQAQPKEKETAQPESAPPDTAARAVAAGAEQISQEAAAAVAAATDGDQSNVASIVDSVLADLRPKLMEEINRKMSKKK